MSKYDVPKLGKDVPARVRLEKAMEYFDSLKEKTPVTVETEDDPDDVSYSTV